MIARPANPSPETSDKPQDNRQPPQRENRTDKPLRVLCLDIEGGYGGSSRSLIEFVRHLDRDVVEIEVWCRKDGPARRAYKALGLASRVEPTMPKVSSLPRLSRNIYVYGREFLTFARARKFNRRLLRATQERFDLVHFNHEALFLLAAWLRPRCTVPFVMHIRTNLHDSPFARWQCRLAAKTMDGFAFITQNELETFERHSGSPPQGKVIHNIVTFATEQSPVHPGIPRDNSFRIAVLSNYSWSRGLDRLIEVAERLADADRRDIRFVVAGNMALSRSLPGALGRIGRRGGTLADYAVERGVSNWFEFLGHVDQPEQVLSACHALAKPTRENNPWGRDILEALAAAKPVLTVGECETFVMHRKTGLIQRDFDAASWAQDILELADNAAFCRRLGSAGRDHVRKLCDGHRRAADLLELWRNARKGQPERNIRSPKRI